MRGVVGLGTRDMGPPRLQHPENPRACWQDRDFSLCVQTTSQGAGWPCRLPHGGRGESAAWVSLTRFSAETGAPALLPYQFRMEEIEGFRYRCRVSGLGARGRRVPGGGEPGLPLRPDRPPVSAQDAMRSVTKQAIREARLKEIKEELLHSEKLKVRAPGPGGGLGGWGMRGSVCSAGGGSLEDSGPSASTTESVNTHSCHACARASPSVVSGGGNTGAPPRGHAERSGECYADRGGGGRVCASAGTAWGGTKGRVRLCRRVLHRRGSECGGGSEIPSAAASGREPGDRHRRRESPLCELKPEVPPGAL